MALLGQRKVEWEVAAAVARGGLSQSGWAPALAARCDREPIVIRPTATIQLIHVVQSLPVLGFSKAQASPFSSPNETPCALHMYRHGTPSGILPSLSPHHGESTTAVSEDSSSQIWLMRSDSALRKVGVMSDVQRARPMRNTGRSSRCKGCERAVDDPAAGNDIP
jgi:hypothetical protein